MSATETTDRVKTKEVQGRRLLHFDTLDDILDDATALAAAGCKPLGNWSFGQACYHLAKTIEGGIDGIDFKAPFLLRMYVKLRKNAWLSKPFPAGFSPPTAITSRLETDEEISDEGGVAMLEKAINRFKTESKRAPSPVFGNLSDEDWVRLHCRHSELHLSFFVPSGG